MGLGDALADFNLKALDLRTQRAELEVGIVYPKTNPSREWVELAECRGVDPSIFFPHRNAEPAKRICARCVVKQRCQHYADEMNVKHGVWGGVSDRGRKKAKGLKR